MAFLYDQGFETLNTGDLNGQDSWSGDTDFDVTTSNPYEGLKCVTGTAANGTISRAFTASTSGVAYFAMRHSGTGDASFVFRTTGNTVTRFLVTFDSTNVVVTSGAGTATLISNYTDNAYYLFECTYNASNQHNIRAHDGSSWGSATGLLNAANNGNVDGVALNQGASGTVFLDIISPNNPRTPTVSPVQGSYTLTGQNVNISRGRRLSAQMGEYSILGKRINKSDWINADKLAEGTTTNAPKL